MLNDLLSVERGLAAGGIALGSRHPDVKDMAKGPALRVRLSADGGIISSDIVPDAGRGVLWTLRDGQHNGFPGLKTASGLLALDAEARQRHQAAWDADKSPAARRAEILRLLAASALDADQLRSWPNAGHRKRIAQRLDALRPLADDPDAASVPAAFERFLRALDGAPSFLEDLAAMLGRLARDRGGEWVEQARAAFLGPVALAIDVPEAGLDPDGFDRDATDPRQVAAVSAALSGAPSAGSDDASITTRCALDGTATRLHTGNAPQPNLPGLGQTYIYARNPDIPSLKRYGLEGDASFPVGAELMRRLAGAADYLTRPDMKDRTWRLLPAETGDKPDLLIVSYLDPDARAAAALADNGPTGETALRELGTRVIGHVSGETSHEVPEHDMAVLLLRTVDPANRKVILHRPVHPAQLHAAAQRWPAAVANCPDWLGFPLPVKGAKGAPFTRPRHVAPLSLTPVSSQAFVAGGRRRVTVAGIPAATALQIFLQEGERPAKPGEALRFLLTRHTALLTGLTLAARSDELSKFDPKADLRRAALSSLSWIGALLYYMDREREKYMPGPGFRLGQLLSVADAVHVGYCHDVRHGSIPPTLLGNALLGTAAANPRKALSLLLRRWPPYAAWSQRQGDIYAKADGESDKRKAAALRTAASHARRVRPLANELCDQLAEAPERLGEVFEAELLLGYMAGLEPLPKKDGTTSSTDPDGTEELGGRDEA